MTATEARQILDLLDLINDVNASPDVLTLKSAIKRIVWVTVKDR